MKKIAPCLLFIGLGMICFHFAFKDRTGSALGITLMIVGLIFFGIGLYKSWKNGIIEQVIDILHIWP